MTASETPTVNAKTAQPAASPHALTDKPYRYCSISKSTWFRLKAAGDTPKPVRLAGCSKPLYRKSDLDRWLAGLPAKRG